MKLFKKKTCHSLTNQPEGTDDIVNTYDVKIPRDFANSPPKQYKMDKYTRSFIKLGRLDKPITVIAEINEKGEPNKLLLVDGLCRYYIAVKYGLKKVPVKYIDINEYIRY